MIDAEVYLATLQKRDIAALALSPAVTIRPDIDVTTLEQVPMITWSLIGTGQSSNGPGLWEYTFFANIFATGMDAAKSVARAWYDVVDNWRNDPQATLLTVDGDAITVALVEDLDLPSRQAQPDIRARTLVQYSGAFNLSLRG